MKFAQTPTTGGSDRAEPLVLLTSPGCHLCEHSRDVLDRLAPELGFTWVEVSSAAEDGESLAIKAPPIRPVLFSADGRAVAAGRLSEKRLRRDLPALIRELRSEAPRG